MLAFWAVVAVFTLGSCAFGFTNMAYGHGKHFTKGDEFKADVIYVHQCDDPEAWLFITNKNTCYYAWDEGEGQDIHYIQLPLPCKCSDGVAAREVE
jgi:hypothetical protein